MVIATNDKGCRVELLIREPGEVAVIEAMRRTPHGIVTVTMHQSKAPEISRTEKIHPYE